MGFRGGLRLDFCDHVSEFDYGIFDGVLCAWKDLVHAHEPMGEVLV